MAFDEGCVAIKIGREEPVASMDASGKVIWARHNDIQTVNIKSLGPDQEVCPCLLSSLTSLPPVDACALSPGCATPCVSANRGTQAEGRRGDVGATRLTCSAGSKLHDTRAELAEPSGRSAVPADLSRLSS